MLARNRLSLGSQEYYVWLHRTNFIRLKRINQKYVASISQSAIGFFSFNCSCLLFPPWFSLVFWFKRKKLVPISLRVWPVKQEG